jgi:spermidine/putrescine-binding protein
VIKKYLRTSAVAVFALGFASCRPTVDPPALNFYNWVDEIGSTTIADFERIAGIKVNAEPLTSNRVLETRLLAGNSGFDVVVPSNNFVPRLVAAGVLQKLDKSRLPNWKHLDPELLRRAAEFDPGNEHVVPYLWGTNGIGLERNAVTRALGGSPPQSWALLFDPQLASKLQACGIAWMQAEWLMSNLAMLYLGIDPGSERAVDLERVEALLMGTRDSVRYYDNYRGDADLLSGEICIEPASSGSILQLQQQVAAAKLPREIVYFVPQEGGMLWMDVLAIPADARNVEAAYRFIDYLLEPKVIAGVTNATRYANANRAAAPWISPEIRDNPIVYPDAVTLARLKVDRAGSETFSRLETRMYGRVQSR